MCTKKPKISQFRKPARGGGKGKGGGGKIGGISSCSKRSGTLRISAGSANQAERAARVLRGVGEPDDGPVEVRRESGETPAALRRR